MSQTGNAFEMEKKFFHHNARIIRRENNNLVETQAQ